MRIAEVVLSLNIGGQERLLVRMVQALRERGHDLHVITLTGGGALRSELENDGVPIYDVVRKAKGFDPTTYTRLYKLFRKIRPDVVHTHNDAPLAFGMPPARLARVPVTVHTRHGHIPYTKNGLRLAQLGTRFVDHFVCVAEHTAEMTRKEEKPKEKRLSVIENGIPLKKFTPDADARTAIRDELGIPRDAFVAGTVGRMVEEKDYPLLVKAMAPLLGEKSRLVFVGDGGERKTVEASIASEVDADKRKFVHLTGARSDVPRALNAFDIFVMSSRHEGLPLVIPEAMASGLPVVSTSVGGIPDVVPPHTGILVSHGDAAALRSAIAKLKDDSAVRQQMAEAARKYALERFSEDRMLDRYLALYASRR